MHRDSPVPRLFISKTAELGLDLFWDSLAPAAPLTDDMMQSKSGTAFQAHGLGHTMCARERSPS